MACQLTRERPAPCFDDFGRPVAAADGYPGPMSRPAAPPDPQHQLIDAVLGTDLVAVCAVHQGEVVSQTPGFARLFGVAPHTSRPLAQLVAPDHHLRVNQAIHHATTGQASRVEFQGVRPDSGRFFAQATVVAAPGDADVVVLSVHDITPWQESAAQLRQLAYHDTLTGLPNRLLLSKRAEQAIENAVEHGHLAGLLIADLDGFKAVNDSHGHPTGDWLLQKVARRLTACIRGPDTAARLGGDEFALVLPKLHCPEDAAVVAARVVKALSAPFRLGTVTATVGVSIGIALCPRDGRDMSTLFASADTALYSVKQSGKRRFAFATESARAVQQVEQVVWQPDYALGVPEVDQEHRALFDALAVLREDTENAREDVHIRESLQALQAATAEHFASEEALMAEAGFVGLPAHKREHTLLLDDLAALAEHARHLALPLVRHVLHKWLVGHLQGTDRAAAAAILEWRKRPPHPPPDAAT